MPPVAFIVLLLGMALPSCHAQPRSPVLPLGEQHSVAIRKGAFRPLQITVQRHDAITWTLVDDRPERLLLDGHFSTVLEGPGSTFTFYFRSAGSYRVYLEYVDHEMTVIVED